MTTKTDTAQTESGVPAQAAQGGCCATPASASNCCEAGPVETVINQAGVTVSACCGKPVNAERAYGSCCG